MAVRHGDTAKIILRSGSYVKPNPDLHDAKVRNLKTQASVLMFIQSHNITDMAQIVRTIESINENYKELADNIKKAERRLVTLAQHITQYEVRSVEQLRKGAENIMREDVQERQPHRAQDIDL